MENTNTANVNTDAQTTTPMPVPVSAPVSAPASASAPVSTNNPTGVIISAIVIVIVIALGAYYFLNKTPSNQIPNALTTTDLQADASIADLSTQGTSTDITNITKDLQATDFSGINAGLENITY